MKLFGDVEIDLIMALAIEAHNLHEGSKHKSGQASIATISYN